MWVWPAVGVGLLIFILGVAAVPARPVGTPEQAASDSRVGDNDTIYSPT